MVIKIKKDLQKRLETFLSTWPTQEEYGGFLFTNRIGNVSEFLLIPNVYSDDRTGHYLMPNTAKALAEKFASARKLRMVAEWHNHPKPAVCSEQDVKVSGYHNTLFSVMISPTNTGYKKDFIWYCHKGLTPEKIVFI